QRSGEEVALHRMAAELAQAPELDLALDALGHDLQAQRAGDLHDGGGDRRVLVLRALVPRAAPRDERAVDLDDVEREALEARQRRVAGAEVVDEDLHADLAQR